LAFPFDFVVVVPETIRELRGARTNDSSEMKEGSGQRSAKPTEQQESHRRTSPS
jgi:hypothetical protein